MIIRRQKAKQLTVYINEFFNVRKRLKYLFQRFQRLFSFFNIVLFQMTSSFVYT